MVVSDKRACPVCGGSSTEGHGAFECSIVFKTQIESLTYELTVLRARSAILEEALIWYATGASSVEYDDDRGERARILLSQLSDAKVKGEAK
jgi:hypothetical protein